jgi:hypothetical protein
MVKVVLHLNALVPLPPNNSSANPGLVPVIRPGSGALTTRGPSWSRDGVAMAACDEPAASGVAPPPAGVAPPASVAPPAAGVVLLAVVAPPAAGVNCDG